MPKRAYVISDLHMAGGDADAALDGFRQDDTFARFVDRISDAETTLIINGDFLDFVQVPPYDVPKPAHLLWTEESSVRKLEAIHKAHEACFQALERFLAAGGRMVVLPGNHDLDLAFAGVQEKLAGWLKPPSAEQLCFAVGSHVFHGVHVEHGYEFTPENCPANPTEFFHQWTEGDGAVHLERVWGTDFMLQFYNQLNREFPYADKVKPLSSIIYHGIKNHWLKGRHFVRLLLFIKRRGLPWGGITSSVLADETEPPTFRDVLGQADDNWRGVLMERYREDPDFVADIEAAIADLDDRDKAALSAHSDIELPEDPFTRPKDETTLGIFREDREVRHARTLLERDGITAVVFGHTHHAIDGNALGDTHPLRGCWFNSGTWLPHLDLERGDIRQKIHAHGLTRDMLGDDSLYATRCVAVELRVHEPHRTELALVPID